MDGVSGLYRSGCIHDLDDLEEVRSRILRARAWRTEYLDTLRRSDPEILKAAEAFSAEMRALAEQRNTPGARRPQTLEDTVKDIDALAERLKSVDAPTIVAALAMDGLDTSKSHWSGDEDSIWGNAVMEAFRGRWGATWNLQKREAERLLLRAGLSKTQISDYLGAVGGGGTPDFPIDPPHVFRNEDLSAELATTDFILRCESYDRGGMFMLYGMQWERLKNLQPDRIRDRIPSMLSSRDADGTVAWRVIESVKGLHFVDELLHRQLAGDQRALEIYAWADDRQWGGDCLHAAFERARKNYSPWGRSRFWTSVQAAGLLDQRFVDAALTELEELEKRSPEKDTDWDKRQYSGLEQALRQFLQAAKAPRENDGAKPATAGALRDWFRKHPEKLDK